MFINVEGVLAKIAQMANEYWGNIPQIFSAIGDAVNVLSRHQINPTDSDWQGVKRVFRYLKGTKLSRENK